MLLVSFLISMAEFAILLPSPATLHQNTDYNSWAPLPLELDWGHVASRGQWNVTECKSSPSGQRQVKNLCVPLLSLSSLSWTFDRHVFWGCSYKVKKGCPTLIWETTTRGRRKGSANDRNVVKFKLLFLRLFDPGTLRDWEGEKKNQEPNTGRWSCYKIHIFSDSGRNYI